jgi:hypothetical protein
MGVLGVLIALSLTAVVIAPPTLSAQDILNWAELDSPDSGLGLKGGWPWVVFLAMDFSAAVCVLVSLFCAFQNESSGIFGVGVWVFAGVTAYANYSFNNVPGAPGDGIWFFPAMSVIGPVLLHGLMHKIRGWVLESAGGRRGNRPKFTVSDWSPLTGTPQTTFGAWRVGGMLGISVPDDALFAYRALTRDRGWWRRWSVNGVVRDAVYEALDAELGDGAMHPKLLALLVPAADGTGTEPAVGTVAGDTERPPFPDPLDEIENDLIGDPPRTPRSRGTRPAPVSAPPVPPTGPRPPSFKGHGTPGDTTAHAGRHEAGTADPSRPPAETGDAGDGTGHLGTGDVFDPDLLRYADHILAITEAYPDWQTKFPGPRPAKRAIDAHWRKIGRSAKPGSEPGFSSTSTTERVLEAMNRLAVQPGINQEIDQLRAAQHRDTDQN